MARQTVTQSARWFLSVLIGGLLFLKPSLAFPGRYDLYCNNRFGFCVEYPNTFTREPTPENGDGGKFHDNQGFVMVVSGINNVMEDSLSAEMASQSKSFDKITYQKKRGNWFVLSGYKGKTILYCKTYVGKAALNHLFLQYPTEKLDTYNCVVKKISRSFKPGELEKAH